MSKMVSSLEKSSSFSFSDKVDSATSVINRSKSRKGCSEQPQEEEEEGSTNKKTEKELQEPSNVHVLILFILFLLFVFFYTGLRVYLRPTKATLPVTVNTFQEYLTEIQQIKYMYFTQTEEFWNILKVNAQQVLTGKEHETPAVMMVVLPAGEKQLAVCLMDYWSQIINRLLGSQITDSALEPPVIDCFNTASYKPGRQKLIISEQIQQLVAGGYKSIIISGWENLHIETVQLLCSICESTNLVYKQVTVTFLLEVPDEEHHIIDKLDIHSYLFSIWSHLQSDQIKHLQTTIASNIAFLTSDDTFMGC